MSVGPPGTSTFTVIGLPSSSVTVGETKTRADCEKAREVAKRGLTAGPCKEVDDLK